MFKSRLKMFKSAIYLIFSQWKNESEITLQCSKLAGFEHFSLKKRIFDAAVKM